MCTVSDIKEELDEKIKNLSDASFEIKEKKEIFNQQALKDPESCKIMEKRLNALIANDQEKKELWNYYLKQNNPDSVQLIESSMDGFNDEEVNNEKYNVRVIETCLNSENASNKENSVI